MATGDVEGNLQRLRVQLRTIGYPHPLDLIGLKEGDPASILPLLHYALLGYSRHVSRYLSEKGYALFAKNDMRFMECTLKFLREEFGYRCALTLAQIFSHGFAERKFMLVHDVIQVCKRKHTELVKLARRAQQERKMCKREPTLSDLAKDIDMGNLDALQMIIERRARDQANAKEKAASSEPNDVKLREFKLNLLEGNGHSSTPTTVNGVVTKSRSLETKDALDSSAGSKPSHEAPSNGESQVLDKTNEDMAKHDDASHGDKEQYSPLSRCYEQLRTEIVDVAENLEKRLLSLEEEVKKMTHNMQAKLGSLESQMRFLEHQCISMGRKAPSSYGNLHLYDRTFPLRRSDENLHIPVSQTIRDISNINQNDLLGSRMPSLEFPQVASINNPFLQQQQHLSTQELIACVRARCNKTKELLGMNKSWHGPSSSQPNDG